MKGVAKLNNLLFSPKADSFNKCIERNSTKQRFSIIGLDVLS